MITTRHQYPQQPESVPCGIVVARNSAESVVGSALVIARAGDVTSETLATPIALEGI
jgi:hypothetical protein